MEKIMDAFAGAATLSLPSGPFPFSFLLYFPFDGGYK